MKVVVTGASGKTGQIVVRKLLENSVDVRPVVRSEASKAKLKAAVPAVDPANVEVVECFEKASHLVLAGNLHEHLLVPLAPVHRHLGLLGIMVEGAGVKAGNSLSFTIVHRPEMDRVFRPVGKDDFNLRGLCPSQLHVALLLSRER